VGASAHAGFVVAAYGAALGIMAALVLWVIADYRAQRRALAALEEQGVTRRSGEAAAEDTH
jgi:heme exporter protein D